MILVIDNYDSFVHNLARYLVQLGETCEVVRNDAIDLEAIARLKPSHIVVSPGPCTPNEAGLSNAVIARFGAAIPILGVCLGHQCIGHVYGARVVRAPKPVHGKASRVRHEGSGLFHTLSNPLTVGRYHSLVVDAGTLPPELEVTAWGPEGEIMALVHRQDPVAGVQFHPESVLTEEGYGLLGNFLRGRLR